MGCCDKKKSINQLYLPLNRRLVDFAIKSTDEAILKRFPTTKLFILTFVDSTKTCIECAEKFTEMINWFSKYNLLEDPINNVKWIFEDEMEKNLIIDDIGLVISPSNLICDGNGNIIDIVTGFPSTEWLEQYLLPMVRG